MGLRSIRHLASAALIAALAAVSSAQSNVVGWGRMRFDSAYNQQTFTQVSAGHAYTVALRTDGTIAGWGMNLAGALDIPAPPSGLAYVEVSGALAGWTTAGLLSDGSVVVWGHNGGGQANVPALPPGVTYAHVTLGSGHVVGLCSDGSVVAWGNNSYGQCNVPALPPGLTYVAAEALAGSTLVRRSDGQILVVGYNADGQCNVPPLPPGVAYTDAAVGYFHIIARRSDGAVVSWGYNINGQCNVPLLAPGLTWVKFAGGTEHSLGLCSDGTIVAWGSNVSGQCDVPPLPPGLTYLPQMAGGGWSQIWGQFVGHSVALRSDGAVICWGQNDYFECSAPRLPLGVEFVEAAAGGTRGSLTYSLGEGHVVARLDDGSVIAWGRRNEGQCDVPPLPAGVTYTGVGAGGQYFSAALRSDGELVAWGNNTYGQCNVPPLTSGLVYEVNGFALGGRHALAIRSDGMIVAWGDSSYGQCNVPPPPPSLRYMSVAAGWRHSAAVLSDGTVVAWGDNSSGECNVPAAPLGTSYFDVAAGYRCTLALRTDQEIAAWGDNSLGQCDVPALSPGATYFDIAAAGEYAPETLRSTTVARMADATGDIESIVVWGDTGSGQGGAPVLPWGYSFSSLSAGGLLSAAVLTFSGDCYPPWNYCASGLNSIGSRATITFEGSMSIAANDLALVVYGCPPFKPGLFFYGAFRTQIPFGEGYLCTTGNQHRLQPALLTDDLGNARYFVDFTDPGSAASLIQPGMELNFQFWYRDPQTVAHGFNLSDALHTQFCP